MAERTTTIIADLEHWKHQYDEQVLLVYLWTPEHESLLQEYADLEAHRTQSGLAPLPWQSDFDKGLSELARLKAESYAPLNEGLQRYCPLSIALDNFLGHDTQDRMYSWDSALRCWQKIQELHETSDELRNYLSPSQQASFLSLRDWWRGEYCDQYLPGSVSAFLESQRGQRSFSTPQDLEEFSLKTKTPVSLYHASCWELFLLEFHPRSWEPNLSCIKLRTLQESRYRTQCHALVQRLCFATIMPPPKQDSHAPTPVVILNEQPWAVRASASEHPGYLWDTASMRTVRVESMPTCPEYICISHTWGRWRSTPIHIAGVPWEVPGNSRFDVQSLPEELKKLNERFVWIDLFCIPQDRSEEASVQIARQASIFRGCRGCVVWLPDVLGWDGVKKGLTWLCLRLHRNTWRDYTSTTSLPNVTDEDLETATAEAGCPSELSEKDSLTHEPVAWFSSLWTLQEAILCPDMMLCSRQWSKLTDAWDRPITLQMLMVFINQSYELGLPDGPTEKSFVRPGAYRTALWSHPQRPAWKEGLERWPLAARQLHYLRFYTRLDNVFVNRSPAVVCTNANVRYCGSKNRAPAIMSALGITDWYKYQQQQQQQQQQQSQSSTWKSLMRTNPIVKKLATDDSIFVLDMYPLAFLQEAHKKFGSLFFQTSRSTKQSTSEVRSILKRGKAVGSMLPFSKTQGWFSGVTGSEEHAQVQVVDHNSVASWEICAGGGVHMKKVGCIEDTTVGAGFVLTLEGHTVQRVDDFLGALKDIAGPAGVLRAVVLYADGRFQHGVILYGLKQKRSTKTPLKLIKVGTFGSYGAAVTEKHVDWMVL